MFCLCVESSHAMGMGHLFRALNFAEHLRSVGEECIFVINDDRRSREVLDGRKKTYEVADLEDFDSDWEAEMVKGYGIEVWANDRLNTDARHAAHVLNSGARLVTLDDGGTGAEKADLHVAALPRPCGESLKGRKVLTGVDYLVLNREIDACRRLRTEAGKIVVTLGGSDTHGATVSVVEILKEMGQGATVITGPNFRHQEALAAAVDERFMVRASVPSLIRAFHGFDLAITGGGLTPFEANASGLPCLIVANEPHEERNAAVLEGLGASLFAGSHDHIDRAVFRSVPDVRAMSAAGLSGITTGGAAMIYREIKAL